MWKGNHDPVDRFPNGESVGEARIRYAAALRRLLSRTERVTLVILHELALRWIVEAATRPLLPLDAAFGSAMPYLFGDRRLEQAAACLFEIASRSCEIESPWPRG